LNPVVYSSATPEWATPKAFFSALDAEFGFTLDPCATPENATCPQFFTVVDDGLTQSWSGTVYMNPPYGYGIGKWVKKAYEEAQAGATVVCLIPAKTETRWWHDYVMRAAEIRLIKGRLRFSGWRVNAPFPSAVVVFRPGEHTPVWSAMNRINDTEDSAHD
jgi:site-specific DNA-methyltransferase (adenine-specific)